MRTTINEFFQSYNKRIAFLMKEIKKVKEEWSKLPYTAFFPFERAMLKREKEIQENELSALYETLQKVKGQSVVIFYEYSFPGEISLKAEGGGVDSILSVCETPFRRMGQTEKTTASFIEKFCCWEMPLCEGRKPDAVFVESMF